MKEQKENKCEIRFYCGRRDFTENYRCIYFLPRENDEHCKFLGDYMFCKSSVAQANKMVLKLKDFGIEV